MSNRVSASGTPFHLRSPAPALADPWPVPCWTTVAALLIGTYTPAAHRTTRRQDAALAAQHPASSHGATGAGKGQLCAELGTRDNRMAGGAWATSDWPNG